MARFRGTLQGSRSEASRLGTAKSGIAAHIHGWNTGVRVVIESGTQGDIVTIWETGGSTAPQNVKRIATWET